MNLHIKGQVQAIHVRVIGHEGSGNRAIGHGIGHIVDQFVNNLMPDHVLLGIDSGLVGKLHDKNRFIVAELQVGFHHAVIIGPVNRCYRALQGHNGQMVFNILQLLQVLRPGPGLPAKERAKAKNAQDDEKMLNVFQGYPPCQEEYSRKYNPAGPAARDAVFCR